MPSVIVAGGGLAGLAAAAALGSSGYTVDLYEAKPYLGGRATSYAIPTGDGSSQTIDNCQHVLLRCCVNLLNFYSRLDVLRDIRFYREFYFIEPGGATSVLRRGALPAPLHFFGSFAKLKFLDVGEKAALGRALLALRSERRRRQDLHQITMLDWLREKKQPQRVIDRFWRQVLVSAINEDLERTAAAHGFQVVWLGFLARSNSYEMGVPAVGLADLYSSAAWRRWKNVRIHTRAGVERLDRDGAVVDGARCVADAYIVAVPFERLDRVYTSVEPPKLEHSPITGIHLWFDRPVTDLPHATLLDRTIQWMFNKEHGRHIHLVVSASRSLLPMSKTEIVDLALKELAEFFPEVLRAALQRAHVVKEVRATFSAAPGIYRAGAQTSDSNVFLAGDWTNSGWPATMEGAVRSGYIAAECVTRMAGDPASFLLRDIA
jgi:squalene-associated FAD-dependent desaturase